MGSRSLSGSLGHGSARAADPTPWPSSPPFPAVMKSPEAPLNAESSQSRLAQPVTCRKLTLALSYMSHAHALPHHTPLNSSDLCGHRRSPTIWSVAGRIRAEALPAVARRGARSTSASHQRHRGRCRRSSIDPWRSVGAPPVAPAHFHPHKSMQSHCSPAFRSQGTAIAHLTKSPNLDATPATHSRV